MSCVGGKSAGCYVSWQPWVGYKPHVYLLPKLMEMAWWLLAAFCPGPAGRGMRPSCIARSAQQAQHSRRSGAAQHAQHGSVLGQQVLQPGLEVGCHEHALHSVHRTAVLEQNQRGQRCSGGGQGGAANQF